MSRANRSVRTETTEGPAAVSPLAEYLLLAAATLLLAASASMVFLPA